jgi:hypothetical protein
MAMLLHVVEELFGRGGIKIEDYLRSTMWEGDVGAVRYLNLHYARVIGKQSVLLDLVEDRRMVFKRWYVVGSGREERELYEMMAGMSGRQRKDFRRELAKEIKKYAELDHIEEGEVLVDVPRRKLGADTDEVWIVREDGTEVGLEAASAPVAALRERYDELARRVRIYVSPRVQQAMEGTKGRLGDRDRVRQMVDAAAGAAGLLRESELG